MEFPDAIHLETIGNALWKDNRGSRAAVMVGAGVSRNAIPTVVGAPPMPLWNTIAAALVARLHTDTKSPEYRRALDNSRSTSGALRLADEFITCHGRAALDELLSETIRDLEYRPSDLHHRLLELPWRDVFTTNYDTLLERAAIDIYKRRYSVVAQIADIATARGPRIVKLHGSMPSIRPFVLSEEDFRLYPRRFAPFVNMTQQSMMENVFCLLGFSGDDPNFLAWSGWVRDELADWAPRIYLVGALDLTDAKRRMLHDRNVTPIDLGPKFPVATEADSGERHRKALKFALDELSRHKPQSPLRWHSLRQTFSRITPATSGTEPSSPTPQKRIEAFNQHSETLRRQYPGWVVAPRAAQEALVHVTLDDIEAVGAALRETPLPGPKSRVACLSHVLWWLDVSLQPLWDNVAEMIVAALKATNPFSKDLVDWPTAYDGQGDSPQELLAFRNQWLELGIGYLRYLREEARDSEFEEWRTRLKPLAVASSSHSDSFRYQCALSARDVADIGALRSELAEWGGDPVDPLWLVRKAALWSELGEVERARTLARAALEHIRRSASSGAYIANMSREGWCMQLLANLGTNDHSDYSKAWPEIAERFEQLASYRCSPSHHSDYFDEVLERPPPSASSTSRTRGFIPGSMNVTHHFGRSLGHALLPAYQLCRMCDEAAVPVRAGMFDMASSLRGAAKWLIPHDASRVRSIILRTFDEKLVEQFFTRHRVATLSSGQLAFWFQKCQAIIGVALPHKTVPRSPTFVVESGRFVGACKIAVRLAIRLGAKESSDLFDLAIARRDACDDFWHVEALENVLAAIVRASSGETRRTFLARLATSTVVGAGGQCAAECPIEDITTRRGIGLAREWSETAGLRSFVVQLFQLVQSSPSHPLRRRAMSRLRFLYSSSLLTKSELREFAGVIWNGARIANTDLPLSLSAPDACLWYPEKKKGRATAAVKKALLRNLFPSIRDPIEVTDPWVVALANGTCRYRNHKSAANVHLLEWSPTEVATIHKALIRWYEAEGPCQRVENNEFLGKSIEWTRCENLCKVIRIVLAPRTRPGSAAAKELLQIVERLSNVGFPVESLSPSLLRFDKAGLAKTTKSLAAAILSDDMDRARSAVDGTVNWIDNQRQNAKARYFKLPKTPDTILDATVQLASNRNAQLAVLGLDAIRFLVDRYPGTLPVGFGDGVVRLLERLVDATRYIPTEVEDAAYDDEDRAAIRLFAAKIAVAMHHVRKSKEPIVRQWLDEIARDPLADVGNLLDVDTEE